MGLFFDDVPLAKSPKASKRADNLTTLAYVKKERRILSVPEIQQLQAGSAVMCDVELYPNFFRVGFKHIDTQTYFAVEMSPATNGQLDRELLRFIMWRFLLVGFNSKTYDLPIIEAALKGATLQQLRELSDRIIFENERNWQAASTFNSVDLIEVAPLTGSLKLYAARLHSERIQELPISPHVELTAEQAEVVRDYNWNDLDCTELLWLELRPHIALREELGARFNKDFRSLSDAQIAERIAQQQLEDTTGHKIKKPGFESAQGLIFAYQAPEYVQFITEPLQKMLADVTGAMITVDINGYAKCPPEIEGRTIEIGGRMYAIGLGGLHSQEKSQAVVATDDMLVLDRDVTGYYPNLILKNKFASAHLGENELIALQDLVNQRTSAKKSGLKVIADSLKISTNGWFGKKADPWSILYDPRAMVQTTITGQLSLLMMIEYLVSVGFEVVSANTDGIVTRVPKDRYAEFCAIFKMWEQHTGLETEETSYKAIYSRDVNNYIAVKDEGCKAKGVYSDKGSALNSPLSKNPERQICNDAVQAFLLTGMPIDRTIANCNDMAKFVSVRNVKGGAHKNGVYLGKVIRWYYANDETGEINYVLSGNKVANTDGARPLMEMRRNEIPADLNREFYEKEALAILYDIGYNKRAEQQRLFA